MIIRRRQTNRPLKDLKGRITQGELSNTPRRPGRFGRRERLIQRMNFDTIKNFDL